MNRLHTVVSGDTLVKISVKYFGTYTKWKSIMISNPQLSGRKKSSDGVPLIFPGDILIVPQEDEIPAKVTNATPVVIDEASEQDISIFVDGKLYTGFDGYTLGFPIDSLDVFSFSAPWQDEKAELRKAFLPFQFKKASVYFEKKLLFCGQLLTSAPEVSPDSKTITIEGFPLCGVLNDCDIPLSLYPVSYSGMTLEQITQNVCGAFGIPVEFATASGEAFEKVEYEPGTKVLDFFKKLAEQRGLIFTNTETGGLKFFKPTVKPVTASFKEGELPFVSCKPTFSSQNMFSHLTGFTKTDNENAAQQYTYENQYLIKAGVFRPTSFTVSDADGTGIEAAVLAKAGQMYAECMSYELTVVGCKDKSGNLYQKGMSISVTAPGAMIYRETKFQVKNVTIKRSDTEGTQTTFSLILPGAMTGTIPEVLPWEE